MKYMRRIENKRGILFFAFPVIFHASANVGIPRSKPGKWKNYMNAGIAKRNIRQNSFDCVLCVKYPATVLRTVKEDVG
jgi:hypothetical protein